MNPTSPPPCPNCLLLQKQVEALLARVAALEAQTRALQSQLAAAQKDSSTSSKPPSSDIVKPAKPALPEGQPGRSRGGQPGHPKHDRVPFTPAQLTGGLFNYDLNDCPCCGCRLVAAAVAPRVVQQVEIPVVPLLITEHRAPAFWCPRCQVLHRADLPAEVEKGGLAGPRLTTLIAYLKGFCHASYSTIRKFLRDVVGVSISRGQLRNVLAKVSAALDGPYEALLQALPQEDVLNVDETGQPHNGDRWWTWCLRASLYTVYKIDPHRSADVLLEVLGQEFNGLLGCDYFSAYHRFRRLSGATLQFCLAHLIRDVRFLCNLENPAAAAYGERLLGGLRKLFGAIHAREKGELAEDVFQARMKEVRHTLVHEGTLHVPAVKECQAMARRMIRDGDAYLTFLTTPGLEPTNNSAEQAIRFVVLDRVVTQGTRSQMGTRWCERIWTVIATCTQQKRSVFAYLEQVVTAFFHGEEAPTLLPQTR